MTENWTPKVGDRVVITNAPQLGVLTVLRWDVAGSDPIITLLGASRVHMKSLDRDHYTRFASELEPAPVPRPQYPVEWLAQRVEHCEECYVVVGLDSDGDLVLRDGMSSVDSYARDATPLGQYDPEVAERLFGPDFESLVWRPTRGEEG